MLSIQPDGYGNYAQALCARKKWVQEHVFSQQVSRSVIPSRAKLVLMVNLSLHHANCLVRIGVYQKTSRKRAGPRSLNRPLAANRGPQLQWHL